MKHDLLTFRREIWPHRDMISMLIRQESGLISDQTDLFLRDCYDHVVQLVEMVETYREIAGGPAGSLSVRAVEPDERDHEGSDHHRDDLHSARASSPACTA